MEFTGGSLKLKGGSMYTFQLILNRETKKRKSSKKNSSETTKKILVEEKIILATKTEAEKKFQEAQKKRVNSFY
jgi:hypothetical protein